MQGNKKPEREKVRNNGRKIKWNIIKEWRENEELNKGFLIWLALYILKDSLISLQECAMSTGSKSCQINIIFNRRIWRRYNNFNTSLSLIMGPIFYGPTFANKNIDRIKIRCFTVGRIATKYWRRDSQEQKQKIAFEIITFSSGHLLKWVKITRWFLTTRSVLSLFHSGCCKTDGSSCTVVAKKKHWVGTLLAICASGWYRNHSKISRSRQTVWVYKILEAESRIFNPIDRMLCTWGIWQN